MSADFVCHPDGSVDPPVEDYPDTGYPMSAEAFAAVETPLAWSAVKPEPHPDEPPHHDWARGLKLASAIAAVALGVVAVVAVLLNPPGHAESTTVTETAMPAGQLPPITSEPPDPGPFVMPTVMAEHETQDGDFFQRARALGMTSDAPAESVKWAHAVCTDLSHGYTARQIAFDVWRNWHEMTEPDYEKLVDIAAAVYCPGLA